MIKQLLTTATIVSGLWLRAADATQNYIQTVTPLSEVKTLPTTYDYTKYAVGVQYYDGLERPMQSVQVGASPSGKDIVTPITYDGYGRQDKDYLPYEATSGTNGSYRSTAITDVVSFYQTGFSGLDGTDKYPYARKVFENSTLNRVLEQGAPGNTWQPAGTGANGETVGGKTIKINYTTNTQPIPYWDVDANYARKTYSANSLYVTEMTDENGVISREYKDFEGKVVLKIANYDAGTISFADISTKSITTTTTQNLYKLSYAETYSPSVLYRIYVRCPEYFNNRSKYRIAGTSWYELPTNLKDKVQAAFVANKFSYYGISNYTKTSIATTTTKTEILIDAEQKSDKNLKTYYCYDVYGNQRLVVPPMAAANNSISSEVGQDIDLYCYI